MPCLCRVVKNEFNCDKFDGPSRCHLPCGFADGMPRGLTFLGNLYDEETILVVARAYEQATDWHAMHPRVM